MAKYYIHVGPGKTGTSAIQNWFLNNQSELKKQSIYYPSHKLDSNGISSGNVRTLFDVDKDDIKFNESKVEKLKQIVADKNYESVVLSSEAFIQNLAPIVNAFPDACYVFYIRSPLETLESLYNQSVKRHFNTKKLILPKTVRFSNIDKILKLKQANPNLDVQFRFYGKRFYQGGDIVSDIMSIIKPSYQVESLSNAINKSYSLESLQFKRELNKIPEPALHHGFDQFLQKYEGKTQDYSLLSSEQFSLYKTKVIEAITPILDKCGLDSSDFVESISDYKQKKVVEQQIEVEECQKILLMCKKESPLLFNKLLNCLPIGKLFGIERSSLYKAAMNIQGRTGFIAKIYNLLRLRKQTDYAELKPSITDVKSIKSLRKNLKTPKTVNDVEMLKAFAKCLEANNDLTSAYRVALSARLLAPEIKELSQICNRLAAKVYIQVKNND